MRTTDHRLDLGAFGTHDVVGDERISKYEFGVRLARPFDLPENLVRRGKIGPSQLTVRRPPDMSLENAKARAFLGSPLGTVADYFPILRQQDRAGRREERPVALME